MERSQADTARQAVPASANLLVTEAGDVFIAEAISVSRRRELGRKASEPPR